MPHEVTFDLLKIQEQFPYQRVCSGASYKQGVLLLLCCLSVSLISCTATVHYRSYLMKQTYVLNNPSSDEFLMQTDNSIPAHRGQRVRLRLDDIRIGFTHRSVVRFVGWDWERGPVALEDNEKNGLGGNDFWLVAEAVSMDNKDIFGVKQKRIMSAINVKLDRESYAFLPLDSSERIVLDEIVDSSYRIRLVLYQIYGYPVKKVLHGAFQGIVPALWQAGKVAVVGLGNAFFAPLVDLIEAKSEEPLFVEKILLEASAERVILGSFDLVSTDPDEQTLRNPRSDVYSEKSGDTGQTYALYDFVKSEIDRDRDGNADKDVAEMDYMSNGRSVKCDNQKLIDLAQTRKDYRAAYLCIHSHNHGIANLPSKQSAKALLAQGLDGGLEKTYIRFTILEGNGNVH